MILPLGATDLLDDYAQYIISDKANERYDTILALRNSTLSDS